MAPQTAEGTVLAPAGPGWWLYLLACADGRTYVGIALDVQARFSVHLRGKGARFTRANRPIRILGAQPFATRSQALRAEHALKRMTREQKLQWAAQWPHSDGPAPLPGP